MTDVDARRALRRRLRTARRAVCPATRRDHSRHMASAAARHVLTRRARRYGCFMSADGEIDTAPLIARAHARGAEIWLPCVRGRELRFRRHAPGGALERGSFGIPEPAAGPLRAVHELDVLFMPLVAFDHRGNRLGMGAGFYDRALAYRRTRSHYRRPWLVGVAFELQRVAALDPAPWDVPLDAVVTERGLQVFAPASGSGPGGPRPAGTRRAARKKDTPCTG